MSESSPRSKFFIPLDMEVIEDMEKLKQKVDKHIHEARHHLRQRHASPTSNLAASKPENDNTCIMTSISNSQSTTVTEKDKTTVILNDKQQPLGDTVHVSKFNKKASVLKVDPSKQEVLVQFGNIKLKLALADVQL
ncbi:hypothetical protein L1987_00514 [Smallanthus sonchifolius]|uniref:Uncharacterized protein n=1 Tax=Smallanthus sonchifolius TaxID=185202 RepID=A0ACB9K2K8_9ASTR|nr:hypothetical protein L1987_00514 [Smallanthus sonchifolius]